MVGRSAQKLARRLRKNLGARAKTVTGGLRLPDEKARIDAAIVDYIETYTEIELVQDAVEGDADPQLSTISTLIGVQMDAAPEGALVDIGSGGGTLLQRMSARLLESTSWQYVPIDVEDKVDEVAKLARKLKLGQRTSPTTIEEFAAEPVAVDGRKLYVCRNVLHELRIDEAAAMVANVCRDFAEGDVLLVQDLLRLPKGERHHHCWLATLLRDAMRAIGFTKVTLDVVSSRSGNQWFNLHVSGLEGRPDAARIRAALLAARRGQWDIWARLAMPDDNLPKRLGPIEEVDLDLQFASLTRELREEGLTVALDADTQRRVRVNELVGRIEELADGPLPQGAVVESPTHFRERGQQLTQAEDFLRSTSRLALVHGGPGTGKTTFIDQVLANRLYSKVLVRVDLRAARGVWPVLERILSQLGLNLDAEVLSVLDDLSYAQVHAAVGRLLNRFAAKMVFVFENVDEALNSNQRFSDQQLKSLLGQVIGKNGAKVIVSSRRDYVPHELNDPAGNIPPVVVTMNRYGSDDTVVNVLDDYFDRAGNGIERYPQPLIAAIDRHPLVAALAGRILAAEGEIVITDETFLRELKRRLRGELLARLMDEASRPAVEVAGELRVPVPATLLERLVTRESIHQARASDVIYSVPDRRWNELLRSLGLFKKRDGAEAMPTSQEIEDRDGIDHSRIADAYLDLYRIDDDPTWIRESHYHRMLDGGAARMKAGVGTYYRTELIASANYCFERRRDFRTALDLYNAAARIEPLDEAAAMWRASCLVRTRKVDEGNAEYRRLVTGYPSNLGMKRSHVDALLAVDEFEAARGRLVEYGLKEAQHDWHAQQWGRVELGLHRYERAIEIFARLRERNASDPYVVTYLARALQQFGDLAGAIAVLERGRGDFPHNVSIATSLAANLERSRRQDGRAKDMLKTLFEEGAGNARAALSLVRILRREGDVDGMTKVVRRLAKAEVVRSMRPIVHMTNTELLMAQGRPDAAASYIREHLTEDESPGLLIDALLDAADSAGDPDEREAPLREAAEVPVPDRLRHNVPVQVDRAKLATRIQDRAMFDAAMANLAATRIDPAELDRLRTHFEGV